MKKVTKFEGYIGGDFDCFCLSKIPFQDWSKLNDMSQLSLEEIPKRENYLDSVLLYPSAFFPEEAKDKKCQFIITVEAKLVPNKHADATLKQESSVEK